MSAFSEFQEWVQEGVQEAGGVEKAARDGGYVMAGLGLILFTAGFAFGAVGFAGVVLWLGVLFTLSGALFALFPGPVMRVLTRVW